MNKTKLCIYLSDHVEYSKIKMFALMHQVSISKLFEDAIVHLMDDEKDNVNDFYYRDGGF